MSHSIQIRNVPDEVHRTLRARAASVGMSLSDYLLENIRRLAAGCGRHTSRGPSRRTGEMGGGLRDDVGDGVVKLRREPVDHLALGLLGGLGFTAR